MHIESSKKPSKKNKTREQIHRHTRFVSSSWIVGEKTAGAEPSCNNEVAMPLTWTENAAQMDRNGDMTMWWCDTHHLFSMKMRHVSNDLPMMSTVCFERSEHIHAYSIYFGTAILCYISLCAAPNQIGTCHHLPILNIMNIHQPFLTSGSTNHY